MNSIELDKKAVWHPYTPLVSEHCPISIKRAKDVYLYTEDGRAILDAISSWWVNIHGHANEYIAKAIGKQAHELEHVIFAGFTHQPAVTFAERLLKILPSNQSKVFYSDNGSTAVEVGVKMALQYWFNKRVTKKRIIALEGAYHGDTFGAMSIGERGPFNAAFQSHLFEVDFIPFPTSENFEKVLDRFSALCTTGEVAAFIFEPLLQGAAGMRMYKSEWLDGLLDVAKQNEVVTIADEVLTGFGRTGQLFASNYLKNKPDIFCLSKGITGGFMAMGVTTCCDKIVSAFESSDKSKTFYHGHSYTANPIACAAANASLDLLLLSSCKEDIKRISERHKFFLENINSSKVKEARSLGTVLAVELVGDEDTSYHNSLRKIIYPYFLERDILLRPLGNIIYILPPYIIKNEELDKIYIEILNFIKKLE
jgi:adenosylmethionine---8-amino-7-oxononanoate aminotransferase